jgi:hypothetical protein
LGASGSALVFIWFEDVTDKKIFRYALFNIPALILYIIMPNLQFQDSLDLAPSQNQSVYSTKVTASQPTFMSGIQNKMLPFMVLAFYNLTAKHNPVQAIKVHPYFAEGFN